MQRIEARERPTKQDVDGKPCTVYDIHGVSKDGHTYSGVVFASWVAVVLRGDPGKRVKVRVWMPGKDHEDVELGFGDKWSAGAAEAGMCSFAPHDRDVEILAWWDLTPGMVNP